MQTIIVTGAGAGIGLATVRHMLAQGWNVVAAVRSPNTFDSETRAAFRDRLLVEALDVTVTGDAERVVAKTLARFGRLDVIVNNAAFGPMGPLEHTTIDDIARAFDTNSIGPVRVAQAALPALRTHRGRIINVSSMGGEFTTPFAGAYHATKYALESLSDALRFEVAPFGVKVSVVQPAAVATDLAKRGVALLAERAEGPYADRLAAFAESSRRQMEAGTGMLTAEQVAVVIAEAATSKQPRSRYKVGTAARVLPLLRRWLPDHLWDALWRRIIPESPSSLRRSPATA
jgi:NAD(P)-dependent dehydrogenase (short-subunit alcohol dehydrogenase family)